MIIAPVIFCTVVTGIAEMESMKAVGKTGAIALLYFEVVSTIALIIGLCVVSLLQPGVGMNVDLAALDARAISAYVEQAKSQGIIAFLLDIIPGSVIGAFASGNILQVLLFAVLFGFSLHHIGEKGQVIFGFINSFSKVIFGIINMIMRLAPVGAFGAMAFTIGKYGVGSLVHWCTGALVHWCTGSLVHWFSWASLLPASSLSSLCRAVWHCFPNQPAVMTSPAPSDRYTRGFLTGMPSVFSLFMALTCAMTSPTWPL